jgi:hypothetical protein
MTDLGYAVLESQPIRYTAREAWVYAEGKWHEMNSADAVHKARVLSATDFHKLFGQLPNLP